MGYIFGMHIFGRLLYTGGVLIRNYGILLSYIVPLVKQLVNLIVSDSEFAAVQIIP